MRIIRNKKTQTLGSLLAFEKVFLNSFKSPFDAAFIKSSQLFHISIKAKNIYQTRVRLTFVQV